MFQASNLQQSAWKFLSPQLYISSSWLLPWLSSRWILFGGGGGGAVRASFVDWSLLHSEAASYEILPSITHPRRAEGALTIHSDSCYRYLVTCHGYRYWSCSCYCSRLLLPLLLSLLLPLPLLLLPLLITATAATAATSTTATAAGTATTTTTTTTASPHQHQHDCTSTLARDAGALNCCETELLLELVQSQGVVSCFSCKIKAGNGVIFLYLNETDLAPLGAMLLGQVQCAC